MSARRRRPRRRDWRLVNAISAFIAADRAAGEPSARLQEAVLAAFPRATADDFALAIWAERSSRG